MFQIGGIVVVFVMVFGGYILAGGKLGIQGSQSIPCYDGSSYGAPRIECQKEQSGQTQCYGVNADGSRYYMGMKRQ